MPLTQAEHVARSSAEFPAYNPQRVDEVQRRHGILAEYLKLRGGDALLLQRPSNISWLTCGADVYRAGTCHATASVFLTPEARVVLTNNVDSPLLFDGPLCGLGFQLKERPWYEAKSLLALDCCRGRKVVTDVPLEGMDCADAEIAQFRTALNEHDEVLLRELARDVTHAVEATCRTCAEGSTESEIAGQVMHRLAHHQVSPVRVQVISDGRGARYRHWGYTDAPLRRFASVVAIGRRHGLHIGLVRTIAFGPPPEALLEAHHRASLVLGTAFYFSQTGWPLGDVWSRAQRIYEKFDSADEWRLADQGEVVGYEACEQPIKPGGAFRLQSGQPVFWHPSIGPALVGETMLVQSEGQLCLTRSAQWPMLTVSVKGAAIELPGILLRDPHESWAVG